MTNKENQWDTVRPQFDALPYPHAALDTTPKNQPERLAIHNLVPAYYLRYQRVVNTEGRWILDAGCGSGYELLALALANPGAHLVGIDLSEKSLELAQKRLEYHGISNPVTLHCLPIEELHTLDYRFDYINCDDVLYLLADPAEGLRAMKSVLKPQGIIRANLHSSLQRTYFYRVQEFFARLGFLQGAPTEEEMTLTRETMTAMQDWVDVKKVTWKPLMETDDERLLMNYLFRGDKGSTLSEFSAYLQAAGLEFISMVDWRSWNLESLFKDLSELPLGVALTIADMTVEEQLHLFELLHANHRLLDLYCGHPDEGTSRAPLEEWTAEQWQTATVHFHPQLSCLAFRQALEVSAEKLGTIAFHEFLKLDSDKVMVMDSSFAVCLYPLLDQPLPMSALVDRWLHMRPVNPITLQPTDPVQAFALLREGLTSLEQNGYVFIELAEDR